jgi:hypothetical protein
MSDVINEELSMKRFLIILLFIITFPAYGLDLAILGYLPSIMGRVAGSDVVWNRFKGREDVGAMSLPVEIKLGIVLVGPVALSAVAGYTFYVEDDFEGLASHNISLGLGIGARPKESQPRTALLGFRAGLYPLYEFPVAAHGKDPIAPWKIALDLGYGISMGIADTNPLIHIYLYGRWVGAFFSVSGRDFFYPNWPDFGVALGIHFLPES